MTICFCINIFITVREIIRIDNIILSSIKTMRIDLIKYCTEIYIISTNNIARFNLKSDKKLHIYNGYVGL